MDWRRSDDSAERFSAYLDEIAGVMGMRHGWPRCAITARGCCLIANKSAEPIAAATAPNATSAKHQSLLHFLAKGERPDEKALGKVRDLVLPQIERHGPIELDHRRHELPQVRVAFGGRVAPRLRPARQAGQLPSRRSLSVANHAASLPVAYRLYLPESWAKDAARRARPAFPMRSSFGPSQDRASAHRMGVRAAWRVAWWRWIARTARICRCAGASGARPDLCGGGVGQDAGAQGRAGEP